MLDYLEHSFHQNPIYWPLPTTSLEQALRTEVLSPRLQSSFCPKQDLTWNSQVMHLFLVHRNNAITITHEYLDQNHLNRKYMCVLSRFGCLRLSLCHPINCSPPGLSVHGILQARILGWVAMPFSRGSSRSRDGIDISSVSCIGKWVLYH